MNDLQVGIELLIAATAAVSSFVTWVLTKLKRKEKK